MFFSIAVTSSSININKGSHNKKGRGGGCGTRGLQDDLIQGYVVETTRDLLEKLSDVGYMC